MRTADRRHVLTALFAVGLAVVLFLLPDPTSINRDNADVEAFRGRIEAIRQPADDRDPMTPPVPIAEVVALDGERSGERLDAWITGQGGSQIVADYRVGEEVLVTVTGAPGEERFVAVADRWRLPGLQLIVLVFAAGVIAVGGWHGLRALVALGLTIGVLLEIVVPLLAAGTPPVPLAVVAATLITAVTVLLTEGWRRSSLAAILGTIGALSLTALLGAAATALLGFSYAAGSDLAFFVTPDGEGLDLRGMLLAAFILGSVGVLDDVTVTQASLVDELAETGLVGRPLVAAAMRIGRSHIAATINTLFLAYVGGGLPLLFTLLVSDLPGVLVLNDELIATEVVRTIAGSLGIVAAVPLTTVIATLLAAPVGRAGRPASGSLAGGSRRATVAAIAAVIATLVIAVAVLPLTGGSRQALTPDTFEPGGPAPSASSGPVPTGTLDPDASGGPPLVGVDEATPIDLDGRAVGSVTVLRSVAAPGDDEASPSAMTASILVRYAADAPFDLSRGEWSILFADGSLFPLVPDGGVAELDRTLQAGETAEISLSGRHPPTDESAWFVLIDAPTGRYLLAHALR